MAATGKNMELEALDESPSPPEQTPQVVLDKSGLPMEIPETPSVTGEPSTMEPEAPQKPEEPVEPIAQEQQPTQAHTRRFSTIINCLASLLGAGILGVPNSIIGSGIIPSIIFMIILCVLSHFATALVIRLEIETGATGLPDISQRTLGRVGYIILDVLNILFTLTTILAYLIIGGDCIMSWFALGGIEMTDKWWKRTLVEMIYSLCIPIAMTIPRNRRFLSYTSLVSSFCIIFFIVALIYKGSSGIAKNGVSKTIVMATISVDSIADAAVYALTFALPPVVLPVIATYTKDVFKRQRVGGITLLLDFILVLLAGLMGYLLFGKDTESNIMQNFSDKDVLMIVVRVAFFFIVSAAYPMVCQALICNWSTVFFHIGDPTALPTWKRAVVLVVSNVIPLLIAMFFSNIKTVLSIGGALGGLIVDFCFPTTMWIIHTKDRWPCLNHILCIILAVFGLIIGIAATVVSILDA